MCKTLRVVLLVMFTREFRNRRPLGRKGREGLAAR